MTDHQKIVHAFTEHDRKESKKNYYNPYALAHYCAAGQRVEAYVQAGYPLRDAVISCFRGRLADEILRSLRLPVMTMDEAKFGIQLPYIELED